MAIEISSKEALNYEIFIYRLYGADYYLARAMAAVLNTRSFSPRYAALKERVDNARSSQDYESLSLEFLLRGQPSDARKSLEKASSMEITSSQKRIIRLDHEDVPAFVLQRKILENLDKAQEILKAALDPIERFRTLNGYVALRDYIDGLVQ